MPRSHPHQAIHTKCTMDEPIQMLIDKLSTKSSDLYIFWQNYDQLYRQYNEKVNENSILRQQIDELKHKLSQSTQKVEVKRDSDSQYLKERLKNIENSNDSLKNEMDKLKNNNRDLRIENSRFIEQTNHMQNLITQLRQENSLQRNSIANILEKLKFAQNQLNSYSRVYEEVQEKNMMINKLVERERQAQKVIEEKDEEIQDLAQLYKETKNKYEKILKESLDNAKQSVIASLHSYKKR